MNTGAEKSYFQKPDYGIDAPGVRRGMLVAGVVGLVIAALAASVLGLRVVGDGLAFEMAVIVGTLGVLVSTYGLFMGGYMTYGSRVGKLKTRDRLLHEVGLLRTWQGGETVLDIGCGRGLMMIGAAKRLNAGMLGIAVGIDLWSAVDQSENTPDAAFGNARIEGVADRVRIDTGDARTLPYADNSFDVVLSHWVIHNLEQAADRQTALDEMLRVLRPDGVMVLADIACFMQYRQHLRARGIAELKFLDGGLEARVMGALSGGSYRPQALIAVKP
jgi:SAM-dependent methyltransferase